MIQKKKKTRKIKYVRIWLRSSFEFRVVILSFCLSPYELVSKNETIVHSKSLLPAKESVCSSLRGL